MHVLDNAWEAVKADFNAACSQSARAARWELTNDLNQLLRRLRRYDGEGEWISILLEGASRFVQQAAIFEVSAGPSPSLKLRGQSHVHLPVDLTFPLTDAAAFASAIASRDPVVALRAAPEVTGHLASPDSEARAHLFPLLNRDRVVAILFAAGQEYVDVNALELIAGVASMVLERAANQSLHLQVAPGMPLAEPARLSTPGPSSASGRTMPSWANLPSAERSLHIQAQRFARVTVAELQLARPEAFRNGRSESNLYLYLKNDVDRAREKYRSRFMRISSMVDYLHLELVRTAAEDDESKLGAEYPGPLL